MMWVTSVRSTTPSTISSRHAGSLSGICQKAWGTPPGLRCARFVFKRNKANAFGGSRALPDEDQAGGFDDRFVFRLLTCLAGTTRSRSNVLRIKLSGCPLMDRPVVA
jgi:hypothetical protein